MRPLRKPWFFQSPKTGSLLVLSIWTLTTLSVFGVGLSRITSLQLKIARRLEERALSQYLAQAAVLHAWALRKADQTPYDTVRELHAVQSRELGRGAFRYTLDDETNRIHLNRASPEILARVPGVGPDGAAAIMTSTWRPFPLKEAVRWVAGVTDEQYQQSRDFLTVYGTGAVNINTAPPEVLRALGLDEGLVDTIARFRAGRDGQEGTADDGVFEQPGEIISVLRSSTGLLATQEAALLQLISQGLLDVKSTALTIHVQTVVLGKPTMRYAIVVDPVQQKIRQWSEW